MKLSAKIQAVLVHTLGWLYAAASRTWIVIEVNRPKAMEKTPEVLAHWHGDELLLLGVFSNKGIAAMASRSKDGKKMTQLLSQLGYAVTRGSSSRGGAGGLKGLVDALVREHRSAALAVDGPRGPLYQVKPGAIKLAQLTGAPIVPGAASAQWKYFFKRAWNRCYFPFPFSRCVIVYGEPIFIAKNLTDEQFENQRAALEAQLKELKKKADSFFAPREKGTKSLQVSHAGV